MPLTDTVTTRLCINGIVSFVSLREEVPLGIFFVFRALVGAISFFFVSWALDGHPYYITPKAAPYTLGWMALYVGEKRVQEHTPCLCARRLLLRVLLRVV